MPDALPARAAGRLTAALYAAAALVVLTAVADAISNAWPFAFGVPQWRYGALGLLSNFLLTASLGALIAVGVAQWRGHARFLRLGGVVLVVVAVLMVLGAIAFTLDALQLYRQVPSDDLRQFQVGAVKAVAKYLGTAVVAAWLGIACWTSGRSLRAERRTDPRLVIGAP